MSERDRDDIVSEHRTVLSHEDDVPAFLDPQTDWVECFICGETITDLTRVKGMDLSGPDEYYPDMVAVCPQHNTGDTDA